MVKVYVGKECFINIFDIKKRVEFIYVGLFWLDRYVYFGKYIMGCEWSGLIDKCVES